MPESHCRHKLFCDAAILYGGLCIEAAANCCLNAIQFSKETERELEFSKTLVKFDLFLKNSDPERMLNRDDPIVAAIEDLISARNGFVHPKVFEVGYVQVGATLQKPKDSPINSYKSLSIPKDKNDWTAFDAHKVYVAVHDFLNFLFFRALGLNERDIDQRQIAKFILNSEMEHLNPRQSYMKKGRFTTTSLNPDSALLKLNKKYDLDGAFFGWWVTTGADGIPKFTKRKLGTPIQWNHT